MYTRVLIVVLCLCSAACSANEVSGPAPSCPALIIAHPLVATYCHKSELQVNCSQPAPPSTIALLGCAPGYKFSDSSLAQRVTCQLDGTWSNQSASCIQGPCNPPCGRNAECREHNGNLHCACQDTYQGDDVLGCSRECESDAECAATLSCQGYVCRDPCLRVKCGLNAACSVVSHFTKCACPAGYKGDPLVHCEMYCGRQLNVTTQLVQGEAVTVGDQPWTVAIYNNRWSIRWSYECAGTLITPSHVVTRAYCMTDANGNTPAASRLRLAAGKLHMDYDTAEPGFQTRGVRAVHVHPRYNDTTRQHNIALLEADSSFQLSWRITPACVDWTGQSLPAPTSAVVTHETLGHVFATQPYTHVPRDQCQREADSDLSKYISNNTFCFRQASDVTCSVVYGAGLTVRHTADSGVVRYFLRGVSSTLLAFTNRDNCVYNQLKAFTALTPHTAWLQQFSNTSDPA